MVTGDTMQWYDKKKALKGLYVHHNMRTALTDLHEAQKVLSVQNGATYTSSIYLYSVTYFGTPGISNLSSLKHGHHWL